MAPVAPPAQAAAGAFQLVDPEHLPEPCIGKFMFIDDVIRAHECVVPELGQVRAVPKLELRLPSSVRSGANLDVELRLANPGADAMILDMRVPGGIDGGAIEVRVFEMTGQDVLTVPAGVQSCASFPDNFHAPHPPIERPRALRIVVEPGGYASLRGQTSAYGYSRTKSDPCPRPGGLPVGRYRVRAEATGLDHVIAWATFEVHAH